MHNIYYPLRFVCLFVRIPDQEQEPEYQKNKNYENSEAPHAAHRSRVTATPVLMNLFSTLVAEINAAPAFDNSAALSEFDKMSAPGAPYPLLLLHKSPKCNIVPVPQFPTFFTPKPSMPNPLTLKAKPILTTGTLGFLQIPTTLVHDQSITIRVRTITPIHSQNHRFAKHIAPLYKKR